MCKTCKHWERLSDRAMGMCYCHPPTADENGYGIWPITPISAKCGQWESK